MLTTHQRALLIVVVLGLAVVGSQAARCEPPTEDDVQKMLAYMDASRILEKIDNDQYVPKLNPKSLAVNQVGCFPHSGTSFQVFQIVDEHEMLVNAMGRVKRRDTVTTMDIANLRSFMQSQANRPPPPMIVLATFMTKGIDTAPYVDGKPLSLSDTYRVSGTTTYTTVSGARRTVFVVEPFDMDGHQLRARYIHARKTRKARERAAWFQGHSRVWTDNTGKFSVRAVFGHYEFIDGMRLVSLEKQDQSMVIVPMSRLSTRDREVVRNHIRGVGK